MWLLIDDIRNLNCDAIARTSAAAKELLKCNCWEGILFDHDLGEYETGYTIMIWMFSMKIYPKKIQIVTANPVGRDNMKAVLVENNYVSKDNITWEK